VFNILIAQDIARQVNNINIRTNVLSRVRRIKDNGALVAESTKGDS